MTKKPKTHLRANKPAGAGTNGHGTNGAGAPPGVSPEDPMVAVVASTLAALAPHLPPEVCQTIALQTMGEQGALAPVLQDLIPGHPNMGAHPILMMRLIDGQGNVGTITAPKTLARPHTLSEAAMLGHMLAMVTSPIARAFLYAYGYRLEFGQTAPAPQKPLIILPGS